MQDFPHSRVFFCGINGAGMSGLARILLEAGVCVEGSDRERVAVSDTLTALGATINFQQVASNLQENVELFVHSAAIRAGHPEFERAGELGIRRVKYAEMLGELSRLRKTIAIAGTHGKTSTTNLTASLFCDAGVDPSWVVGGSPLALPAASHWGEGQHLIVEACEYDRSFHQLRPEISLLHNIEADHMDYYGSMANLKQSFADFAALSSESETGVLLANIDDPLVAEIAGAHQGRVISYGLSSTADIRAERVRFTEGHISFELEIDGTRQRITPGIPGRTALPNALAAAAVGVVSGLDLATISEGLAKAKTVARRFEQLASSRGIEIYDDYAHHPTSVKELAASARSKFNGRPLTFIFQAHQYARLVGFFDEFADGLSGIDRVIVCPTFAARESDVTPGEPEAALVDVLRSRGCDAEYAPALDSAIEMIELTAMQEDVIFSVGAGDVTNIGHELAARLKALHRPSSRPRLHSTSTKRRAA